jgi:hypothetical protein
MADGNITAARQKLAKAIADLIDPQHRTILRDNGTTRHTTIASRYQHLQDSLGGQQVETKAGGQARLPIWADAMDALTEIDQTVTRWCKRGTNTTQRLGHIDNHTFRPQDTDLVTDWARQLNSWINRIDQLLEPESTKEVLAPCPSCGQRYHYRIQAGERVREAALQVTGATGCTCLCCKTNWGPQQYLFLLRLIGGELPAGVLE